jgi:hypothetical protein
MIGDNGKTVQPETPILPVSVMPQVATQLSTEIPPIDDESFEPVTADELSRAVAALSKRLPDEAAAGFYRTVKRHIHKNYEPRAKNMKTGKISEASLRRMIRKVLLETSYDERRKMYGNYDDRKLQDRLAKEEEKAKKYYPQKVPLNNEYVVPLTLDDLQFAFDYEGKDTFELKVKEAIKILQDFNIITIPHNAFIQIAKPLQNLSFYSSLAGDSFYVKDDYENVFEIQGRYFQGPAFSSQQKNISGPRDLVKILKNYDPSEDTDSLKYLAKETGFGSESAVKQFITRTKEKLNLISLVFDKEVNKDVQIKLKLKLIQLIKNSSYDGKNELIDFLNSTKKDLVLQQIYGELSSKSSSKNLRSYLNNELASLENQNYLQKNKRNITDKIINDNPGIPRYVFETQLTNLLTNQSINYEAIENRLKTPQEKQLFIAKLVDAAEQIIDSIENEDLVDYFDQQESFTNISPYYKSILDGIAQLNIKNLQKAIETLKNDPITSSNMQKQIEWLYFYDYLSK